MIGKDGDGGHQRSAIFIWAGVVICYPVVKLLLLAMGSCTRYPIPFLFVYNNFTPLGQPQFKSGVCRLIGFG